MPSPIELDTKRWTKVVPPGAKSQTVKCLNFACYYSTEPEPPEKASEGTELSTNSTVTLEANRPRWFRAKEPASTEAPFQPSILEVQALQPESIGAGQLEANAVEAAAIASEAVETAKIKNLAVTTGKLAANAVTAAKVETESVPVAGASEGELVPGTAGVLRVVSVAYTNKTAETAIKKVVHNLSTEIVSLVGIYKLTTKKLGTLSANFAVERKAEIKAENTKEIEVKLSAELGAGEYMFLIAG